MREKSHILRGTSTLLFALAMGVVFASGCASKPCRKPQILSSQPPCGAPAAPPLNSSCPVQVPTAPVGAQAVVPSVPVPQASMALPADAIIPGPPVAAVPAPQIMAQPAQQIVPQPLPQQPMPQAMPQPMPQQQQQQQPNYAPYGQNQQQQQPYAPQQQAQGSYNQGNNSYDNTLRPLVPPAPPSS